MLRKIKYTMHPEAIFASYKSHIEDNIAILRNFKNKKDLDIAVEFLYQYRNSEATYSSYRREIERLLQWSENIACKPLTALEIIDIEAYLKFVTKPPNNWVAKQQFNRAITENFKIKPNPNWRPFVNNKKTSSYSLSKKSMEALITILNSFFNYLLQRKYININPFAILRQKKKYLPATHQNLKIRRLSELQWIYVLESTEHLAKKNLNHERSLFIINALYAMYLRISELAVSKHWSPKMCDFFQDSDGNWWFKTLGKGNKIRDITVSDSMLKALKRYRNYLNLSNLPSSRDTSPLIRKTKSLEAISSTRQIRNIVQKCFDYAIKRLEKDNFLDEASLLKDATVHWLRHTGISDAVKTRPKEHVRDDAGHGSSVITDKYIDIDKRERHASNRKQIINPFVKANGVNKNDN